MIYPDIPGEVPKGSTGEVTSPEGKCPPPGSGAGRGMGEVPYLPPEGEVHPAAAEGGGSAGGSHFPPRGKCPLRQRGLIEIVGEVMMTSPGRGSSQAAAWVRGGGKGMLFWGASAARG